MTPIGRYRHLVAAGWAGHSEPLHDWSPFFAWRVLTLPFSRGVQMQILVSAFGSTAWINVNSNDIELFQLSENI